MKKQVFTAAHKYYEADISAFLIEMDVSPSATDYYIPIMLYKVIPTGLIGIIAVLILSASMSTLASVSLSSASAFAVDVYKGKINERASDKQVNIVMRALCVVFIGISVVLAVLNEEFGISAIAYMMGLSWGTLAGCFMGPFVVGLLWRGVTKSGAWASIISTLVLTCGLVVFFGYHRNGFACSFGKAIADGINTSPLIGCICMATSVIITVVVSLLTRKPSDEAIYNAFEKPIENEV